MNIVELDEIVLDVCHGEGGDDSKLFVEELFSAYLKYARNLNFKAELLLSADGHMVAKLKGNGVGRAFQYESGKHCVQRIPPTESKGRKQTSMVSVAILPIPKKIDIVIPDSDLNIEPVNLGGPGGQHRNKTLSDCRMTHIPTGTQVCIGGRDFHSNVREARQIICAKVAEKVRQEEHAKYSENRQSQMDGGGRGNKIRTYNFMEGRVVDHRLGTKTGNVKGVMKGQFELILS